MAFHGICFCAGSAGVAEYMDSGKAHVFYKITAVFKSFFCFLISCIYASPLSFQINPDSYCQFFSFSPGVFILPSARKTFADTVLHPQLTKLTLPAIFFSHIFNPFILSFFLCSLLWKKVVISVSRSVESLVPQGFPVHRVPYVLRDFESAPL